jgi:hypothetical protein
MANIYIVTSTPNKYHSSIQTFLYSFRINERGLLFINDMRKFSIMGLLPIFSTLVFEFPDFAWRTKMHRVPSHNGNRSAGPAAASLNPQPDAPSR